MAPSPPAGRDSSDGGLMGYGLKIKRGVSRVFTRQRLFPIQCTVAKPEAPKKSNKQPNITSNINKHHIIKATAEVKAEGSQLNKESASRE